MNSLKWIFPLLIISISFLACDDETGGGNGSGDGVPGSWRMTAIDYTGTSTTTVSGQTVSADFTGTGYDISQEITFNENPNTYSTAGSYSVELVTTVGGQTTTIPWTNQNFLDNGTWSQNGNVITATPQSTGTPGDATIISINETTMVLGYDHVEVTTQQGATSTYNVSGTYTFERL